MFKLSHSNYKNKLLEISARHFRVLQPEYFHFEYGPDHAKVFLCICSFQRKTTSHEGRTKIEAEQLASQEMLELLESGIENYNDETDNHASAIIAPELAVIAQTLRIDPQFDVLSLYGDAVFRYHIVRYLFNKYSQFQEGVLTRITSEALRMETRANMAQRLKLEICVRTSVTSRTLAQAFSAVMGKCAFLHGDQFCAEFIQKHYKIFIDLAVVQILSAQILDESLVPAYSIETKIHNYKNELLEYAQRNKLAEPTYSLLERTGETHAPIFTVVCHFQDQETTGQGKTIKSAEQKATQHMLTHIKKRDAASTRRVTESSSSSFSSSRVKRFKALALNELKRSIGWGHFNDLDNLQAAFTHPCKNQYINYQRLEFLGDALVKKMLFSYIMTHYPEIQDKDMMSSRMDQLVSEEAQANVAVTLNIGQHVFTDTAITSSLLSDVLEAMTAAIFLDAEKNKINRSEMYMTMWFKPEIEAIFGKINRKSVGITHATSTELSSNPQRFLNTHVAKNSTKLGKQKEAKKSPYKSSIPLK
jgi:ribonuclease-3